jgi:hypothetical protein
MQEKGRAKRIQNKTGRCRRNRNTEGNNRKQRQQQKECSRIAQPAQHNLAMSHDIPYQACDPVQVQAGLRFPF